MLEGKVNRKLTLEDTSVCTIFKLNFFFLRGGGEEEMTHPKKTISAVGFSGLFYAP